MDYWKMRQQRRRHKLKGRICPILLKSVDVHTGVLASDGHMYNGAAFAQWVQVSTRSPLTRAELQRGVTCGKGFLRSDGCIYNTPGGLFGIPLKHAFAHGLI